MKTFFVWCLVFVIVLGCYSVPSTQAFQTLQHMQGDQASRVILVADESKLTSGAQSFISAMAKRGIDFLANPDLTLDQRSKEFEKLLASSFDMNTIAKFSLGPHWKTATAAQREEYLKLFRKMVIEVYSKRFGEYEGQDFTVSGAREQGKSDAIVTSYIIPKEGPQIEVEWRVRYKNGQYKVIDVIVEGVSMGVTQRADFASVIQRGGGDLNVLIEHLRGA